MDTAVFIEYLPSNKVSETTLNSHQNILTLLAMGFDLVGIVVGSWEYSRRFTCMATDV